MEDKKKLESYLKAKTRPRFPLVTVRRCTAISLADNKSSMAAKHVRPRVTPELPPQGSNCSTFHHNHHER
jgi:hypothetical protein